MNLYVRLKIQRQKRKRGEKILFTKPFILQIVLFASVRREQVYLSPYIRHSIKKDDEKQPYPTTELNTFLLTYLILRTHYIVSPRGWEEETYIEKAPSILCQTPIKTIPQTHEKIGYSRNPFSGQYKQKLGSRENSSRLKECHPFVIDK